MPPRRNYSLPVPPEVHQILNELVLPALDRLAATCGPRTMVHRARSKAAHQCLRFTASLRTWVERLDAELEECYHTPPLEEGADDTNGDTYPFPGHSTRKQPKRAKGGAE